MHLFFLLAALLHLTTAIPTVQPKTLDLQPRQRPCAINNKISEYMKKAVQGFCTPMMNQDPGGYLDDVIGLDFDFDFGTNLCGYHVYWDNNCNTCARSTLNRTSVEVGPHGIACLSQHANGGWWKSIKAAPCDGTGVGCWHGGMLEREQGHGPG